MESVERKRSANCTCARLQIAINNQSHFVIPVATDMTKWGLIQKIDVVEVCKTKDCIPESSSRSNTNYISSCISLCENCTSVQLDPEINSTARVDFEAFLKNLFFANEVAKATVILGCAKSNSPTALNDEVKSGSKKKSLPSTFDAFIFPMGKSLARVELISSRGSRCGDALDSLVTPVGNWAVTNAGTEETVRDESGLQMPLAQTSPSILSLQSRMKNSDHRPPIHKGTTVTGRTSIGAAQKRSKHLNSDAPIPRPSRKSKTDMQKRLQEENIKMREVTSLLDDGNLGSSSSRSSRKSCTTPNGVRSSSSVAVDSAPSSTESLLGFSASALLNGVELETESGYTTETTCIVISTSSGEKSVQSLPALYDTSFEAGSPYEDYSECESGSTLPNSTGVLSSGNSSDSDNRGRQSRSMRRTDSNRSDDDSIAANSESAVGIAFNRCFAVTVSGGEISSGCISSSSSNSGKHLMDFESAGSGLNLPQHRQEQLELRMQVRLPHDQVSKRLSISRPESLIGDEIVPTNLSLRTSRERQRVTQPPVRDFSRRIMPVPFPGYGDNDGGEGGTVDDSDAPRDSHTRGIVAVGREGVECGETRPVDCDSRSLGGSSSFFAYDDDDDDGSRSIFPALNSALEPYAAFGHIENLESTSAAVNSVYQPRLTGMSTNELVSDTELAKDAEYTSPVPPFVDEGSGAAGQVDSIDRLVYSGERASQGLEYGYGYGAGMYVSDPEASLDYSRPDSQVDSLGKGGDRSNSQQGREASHVSATAKAGHAISSFGTDSTANSSMSASSGGHEKASAVKSESVPMAPSSSSRSSSSRDTACMPHRTSNVMETVFSIFKHVASPLTRIYTSPSRQAAWETMMNPSYRTSQSPAALTHTDHSGSAQPTSPPTLRNVVPPPASPPPSHSFAVRAPISSAYSPPEEFPCTPTAAPTAGRLNQHISNTAITGSDIAAVPVPAPPPQSLFKMVTGAVQHGSTVVDRKSPTAHAPAALHRKTIIDEESCEEASHRSRTYYGEVTNADDATCHDFFRTEMETFDAYSLLNTTSTSSQWFAHDATTPAVQVAADAEMDASQSLPQQAGRKKRGRESEDINSGLRRSTRVKKLEKDQSRLSSAASSSLSCDASCLATGTEASRPTADVTLASDGSGTEASRVYPGDKGRADSKNGRGSTDAQLSSKSLYERILSSPAHGFRQVKRAAGAECAAESRRSENATDSLAGSLIDDHYDMRGGGGVGGGVLGDGARSSRKDNQENERCEPTASDVKELVKDLAALPAGVQKLISGCLVEHDMDPVSCALTLAQKLFIAYTNSRNKDNRNKLSKSTTKKTDIVTARKRASKVNEQNEAGRSQGGILQSGVDAEPAASDTPLGWSLVAKVLNVLNKIGKQRFSNSRTKVISVIAACLLRAIVACELCSQQDAAQVATGASSMQPASTQEVASTEEEEEKVEVQVGEEVNSLAQCLLSPVRRSQATAPSSKHDCDEEEGEGEGRLTRSSADLARHRMLRKILWACCERMGLALASPTLLNVDLAWIFRWSNGSNGYNGDTGTERNRSKSKAEMKTDNQGALFPIPERDEKMETGSAFRPHAAYVIQCLSDTYATAAPTGMLAVVLKELRYEFYVYSGDTPDKPKLSMEAAAAAAPLRSRAAVSFLKQTVGTGKTAGGTTEVGDDMQGPEAAPAELAGAGGAAGGGAGGSRGKGKESALVIDAADSKPPKGENSIVGRRKIRLRTDSRVTRLVGEGGVVTGPLQLKSTTHFGTGHVSTASGGVVPAAAQELHIGGNSLGRSSRYGQAPGPFPQVSLNRPFISDNSSSSRSSIIGAAGGGGVGPKSKSAHGSRGPKELVRKDIFNSVTNKRNCVRSPSKISSGRQRLSMADTHSSSSLPHLGGIGNAKLHGQLFSSPAIDRRRSSVSEIPDTPYESNATTVRAAVPDTPDVSLPRQRQPTADRLTAEEFMRTFQSTDTRGGRNNNFPVGGGNNNVRTLGRRHTIAASNTSTNNSTTGNTSTNNSTAGGEVYTRQVQAMHQDFFSTSDSVQEWSNSADRERESRMRKRSRR